MKSVVVAIDFGTSCSGFSYIYKKDESETIFVRDDWEGGGGLNKKTLTQIVLDEKGKCVAFGYEARDYFNTHDVDPNSFPHFSFFKMHLFDLQNRAQPIKSSNSKNVASAQKLITESLRFLKDQAIKKIQSQSSINIDSKDIQWVLTIPAIWDDPSKQIMRQCADEAGLCSKHDKDSLIFAFEPEAGALQCIFEKTSSTSVSVGNKFMVIDNGGGTSDVIAYKQLENNKLMAISKSFGGDYGSIYVNRYFFNFLVEVFGEEIKNRIEYPQFQVLMDRFESLKRSFSSFDSNSIMALDLNSISVFGKDQSWLENKIEEYNKKSCSKLKYTIREKLIIPYNLFLSFFTPLFNNITDLIKNEIKSNDELQKLDFIFLIGGFNENIHLQEHLKKELGFTGAKFIVSLNPSLAVVKGASRFGLNPNIISQRKQTTSYAIQISDEVLPGKHIGKNFIIARGITYCTTVCDVYVHANQMVGYDEVITRNYVPIYDNQKSICFQIFSSHMPTINYSDDPGVQFIGDLTIDLPDPSAPRLENSVDVSMKFAKTEIEVNALHIKSGKYVNASFDFILDGADSYKRYKQQQIKNSIITGL